MVCVQEIFLKGELIEVKRYYANSTRQPDKRNCGIVIEQQKKKGDCMVNKDLVREELKKRGIKTREEFEQAFKKQEKVNVGIMTTQTAKNEVRAS